MFDFQKVQIQKYSKNADRIISSSIFNDDNYFVYVFKKAERILAALYMMSNFFDIDEPAKVRIRTLGLDFLSLSIKISDQSSFSRDQSIKMLAAILLELTSIFEISFLSGMVSEMNHAILRREFDTLLEIVISLEKAGRMGESVVLSDPFFAVFDSETSARTGEKSAVMRSNPDLKPKESERDAPSGGHKKDSGSDDIKQDFSKGQYKGHSDVNDKKEIRKNLILSLLGRRDALTIREISAVIHDCSQKTVQRELQALVDQNVLNKAGERRWTRYFLPKTQHS